MATPLWLALLKEAASGTTPTTANDTSSGTPVNLILTFAGSDSWTSIGSGNGVSFTAANQSRGMTADTSGTKIQTGIQGSTTITAEFVANATVGCALSLVDTGNDNQAVACFFASAGTLLDCYAGNARYIFNISTGLHRYHLSVDSGNAAGSRLILSQDGSPASVNVIVSELTAASAVDNGMIWGTNSCRICVGTFDGFSDWLTGSVYEAAIYTAALTSGQVSANQTALGTNNDADPNGAAAAAFVPYRRQAPQVAPDDPPPPQRRMFRIPPPAAAASTFVPYRRQPPQQPDEQQYLFMGIRSATIQGGPAAPDSPPLGWPRRVLSLFRQTEDDPPRLRRPTVTASGLPPVIPDNPPVGWPRRVIALAQWVPADDEVRIQQRRFALTSGPIVVPDNPPWGWPRRVLSMPQPAEEIQPPQQMRKVPAGAAIVPSNPPWGWPRRLAGMRAMAEAMPDDLGRRPSSIAAAIAPPPVVPPFQAGPFTIAPVDVVLTIREVTT